MEPAFAYPGGKSWAKKHILPKITPHECYCEPFAGGLAILLAKEPSRIEVVNDINSELVIFYRCVKYHLDELIKELQWLPNSREIFLALKESHSMTDIQRAARWYRLQTLSFGGNGDSYGAQRRSGGGVNRSRHLLMEKLEALNLRLDRVNIEHLDWERCVKIYDGPGTFFFIDPPYVGGHIKNYAAWSITDIERLRDTLDSLKGDYLLTINDSPEIRELFKGKKIRSLERVRGIANKNGSAGVYRELLVGQ